MNSQQLYEDSKWKQYYQRLLLENEQTKIKQLASSSKANTQSHKILTSKLQSDLQHFPDEELVNLQTSIPILHAAGVLSLLTSIPQAKEKLASGQENQRMKSEAKFVYYLWKLIDQQQVQCKQIKQIIFLLNQRKPEQLNSVFGLMFSNQEDIGDFIDSWKMLNLDKQYYNYKHKSKHNLNPSVENSKDFSEDENVCPLKVKQFDNNQNFENTGTINKSYFEKNRFQLSKQKANQLVSRLYQPNIGRIKEQMKNQRQKLKENQQLQACTFKPQLQGRKRPTSVHKSISKPVKGYEKAIGRLRNGTQKRGIEKKLREYKPTGQNYQKLKQKGMNPPKFLSRKKQQSDVLFMIEFDLGRYKTKVKIRQNDTEDSVAKRLCQIYCLKQDYYDQICQIVGKQLENFYAEQIRVEDMGNNICYR